MAFVAPVFIKKQGNLDQPRGGVELVGNGGGCLDGLSPPNDMLCERDLMVASSKDMTELS